MQHDKIYSQNNELYELLVSHEDASEALPKALSELVDFDGKDVVEFGAGTGRLTQIFAPWCRSVRAFDISQHMLDLAEQKLASVGITNCSLEVGEHTRIQLRAQSADIAIAGWTISYLTKNYPALDRVDKAIANMKSCLRPGGTLILIETLGTGNEEPIAPTERLKKLYHHFETAHGLTRHSIRTDYFFEDVKDAKHAVGAFFDDHILSKLSTGPTGATLPECTGIWIKLLNAGI